MIEVFDNFLPKTYHKELLEILNGPDFPWFYNSNISDEEEEGSVYEYGFSHTFWDTGGMRNSEMAQFWKPGLLLIMDAISESQEHTILRSRADMTMASPGPFVHGAHTDFDFDNIATLLYMNDSDGDTILYSADGITGWTEERTSPKANRLIMFNGNDLHTGCSPSKTKNRIAINSNFETEKL